MAPPSSTAAQAVSYTSAMRPGSGLQSGCMPFFTEPRTAYTLSSAVQEHRGSLLETGSLPQLPEAPSQQSFPSPDHGCRLYGPMTLYHPGHPRNQSVLASHCYDTEDSDYLSYHDSPVSGIIPLDFRHSPIPSATWQVSSETPFHFANQACHQQPDWPRSQDRCPQTSSKECPFDVSEAAMPYQSNFPHLLGPMPAGAYVQRYSPRISHDKSPPTLTSCANSPYEPPVATPTPSEQPKVESPADNNTAQSSPLSAAPSKTHSTKGGGAKDNEPYAKLIERALLSAPDYRMQLQEIYAWFVQNTDKANSDGRGWQNSIRHNLSMNAAFAKTQDQKRQECLSGDSKRSTEWMLESWAVEDGVQSTTRYRKANSSRKFSAAKTYGHPYRLDARPGARLLSSHGHSWERRSSQLRGPAYGSGLPTTTAFSGDGAAGRSLPANRSTTPGFYRSIYNMPTRLGIGGMDLPKSGPQGGPLDPGPSQPQPFSLMMPTHPNMTNSMSTGMSLMGANTSHSDVAPPSYYDLSQSSYPYNVSDVHVAYSGRPRSTADSHIASSLGSRADGLCGYGEHGL